MKMLPPSVQAKYDFECFGKGAAQLALLDLTVTGVQPVAVLHRQVMEVCFGRAPPSVSFSSFP